MLDLLRGLSLFAATLSTGVMTGVFGIYANAIMPASPGIAPPQAMK